MKELEKEFEEMTNVEVDIESSVGEVNKLLTENSDKHLFNNKCYGAPLLDLSKEKVLAFLRSALTKAFKEVRPTPHELGQLSPEMEDKQLERYKEGHTACLAEYDANVKKYME